MSSMKKEITYKIILLLSILMMNCLVIPGSAAATESPTVKIGTVDALPGGTVSVPISIDDPRGMAGYGLEIQYDPSVLTPSATVQTGTAGGISSQTFNPTYSANTIFIAWSGTSALTSGGSLAIVTFTVNSSAKTGNTSLKWCTSNTAVNDINGSDITNNFTFAAGAINVQATTAAVDNTTVTTPATNSANTGGSSSSSSNSGSSTVNAPTVQTGDTALIEEESSQPTVLKAKVFADTAASYWGYKAISSLTSKDIISGYPDGTFKPDASITRAEFATILVKALGLNISGTTGKFMDVTGDAWYYGTVNAAASTNLISGMGDNLFAPNTLITREQMALMISKALGDKTPAADGTELSTFKDKSAVSSWAISGMIKAARAGIISGMTTDTLAPTANATRAQATEMIYKMLNIFGK
jgi:hypothetical protein